MTSLLWWKTAWCGDSRYTERVTLMLSPAAVPAKYNID